MCVLENFAFDLDVPKSIPFDENANRNNQKPCKPWSFVRWLNLKPWYLNDEVFGRVEVKALSTLWMVEGDLIKTLILKSVFIRFPIGLKWLEPIKDLGHLI